MTIQSNVLLHLRLPESLQAKATGQQDKRTTESPPSGMATDPFLVGTIDLSSSNLDLFISPKKAGALVADKFELTLPKGKHSFTFIESPSPTHGQQFYKLDVATKTRPKQKLKLVESVEDKILYKLDLGVKQSFKGKQGGKFAKLLASSIGTPIKGKSPIELVLASFAGKGAKRVYPLHDVELFVAQSETLELPAMDRPQVIALEEKTSSPKKEAIPPPLRIGVWDLGAWLGQLPKLLDAMSVAQPRYAFFAVEATVPVGMIRARESVIPWIKENTDEELAEEDRSEIENNMIANDFFAIGETVRKDLEVDYLVGVTPSMVAGESEDGEIYWNHFSSFEGKCVLASTYDLRSFARETKRPFELFLAGIIVAQLLTAQFWGSGLGFHRQNRGCLFDYNEDRASIMDKIDKVEIEPGCLKRIGPEFRDAAVALAKFLRVYK
jgi:hypothetical protein